MCNASTLNKKNEKELIEKGVSGGQDRTSDPRTSESATSQELRCCCCCAVLPTVEAKGGAKKRKREPEVLHRADRTTVNRELIRSDMFLTLEWLVKPKPMMCSSQHANRFSSRQSRPCGILCRFPSSATIHHHRINIHSWPSGHACDQSPAEMPPRRLPVRKLYLSHQQLWHSHSHISPHPESGLIAISRL